MAQINAAPLVQRMSTNKPLSGADHRFGTIIYDT